MYLPVCKISAFHHSHRKSGNGQIDKTDDIRLVPEDIINVIRFHRSIRNFKKTEIPKRQWNGF